MTEAPTLHTNRLTLRAGRMADFEPIAATLTSERAKYIGGPYDRETAWDKFAGAVGSWALQGLGDWTIADRATGAVLGTAGIGQPPHFPETEIGWVLVEDAEGRGIATEAASAILAHAFGPMGLATLVSYIEPENTRSIALAQRLGAVPDADAARPWPEDVVYRHAPKEAA